MRACRQEDGQREADHEHHQVAGQAGVIAVEAAFQGARETGGQPAQAGKRNQRGELHGEGSDFLIPPHGANRHGFVVIPFHGNGH